MAVPARPISGNPIDSVWGQVAHDAAVAQDVQSGTASVAMGNTAAATVVVTFPRPFAAPPVVSAAAVWVSGASGPVVSLQGAPTATQVTFRMNMMNGATSSLTLPFHWIAVGPRA